VSVSGFRRPGLDRLIESSVIITMSFRRLREAKSEEPAVPQNRKAKQLFSLRDPFIQLRFQNIQRQRALIEHGIVKSMHIEFRA
jgi:hypothetical protein